MCVFSNCWLLYWRISYDIHSCQLPVRMFGLCDASFESSLGASSAKVHGRMLKVCPIFLTDFNCSIVKQLQCATSSLECLVLFGISQTSTTCEHTVFSIHCILSCNHFMFIHLIFIGLISPIFHLFKRILSWTLFIKT